jgi:hypothetical protein
MKNKIFLFLILMASAHANAQILDAIRGHTQDIKARFSDHQTITGMVVKQGEIDTAAKGQDFLHQSSGTWSVVRVGNDLYLQSSENFSSSPGPDYHVYVSRGAAIKDNDEFDGTQIEVAPLTKPNGAAYYKLATNDIDTVNSVLIWCKQFNEYIGSADLMAKASALN